MFKLVKTLYIPLRLEVSLLQVSNQFLTQGWHAIPSGVKHGPAKTPCAQEYSIIFYPLRSIFETQPNSSMNFQYVAKRKQNTKKAGNLCKSLRNPHESAAIRCNMLNPNES